MPNSRTHVRAAAQTGARRVALIGASGGVGQPLSLLLKLQPTYVAEIALYDIANTDGVATDLSHCNTPVQVTSHTGPAELGAALQTADVVVIVAGIAQKPGMSRDDLFDTNAHVIQAVTESIAQHCPQAVVVIITNPVNVLTPLAAEVLKGHGVHDPRKVLGMTTLDVVRADTFVARARGLDALPRVTFSDSEAAELTEQIRHAGIHVLELKAGAGSSTLATAYAAARLIESILRGLEGEPNIYEAAFVECRITEADFFASKVRLGPNGAEEVLPIGKMSPMEENELAELIPVLKRSIEKGRAFVREHK
ncbi:Malate dehydrogenase, mitochondrial [Coccomyxa sp. Obi]|nr:Malate dehydrogenase, mitochondrial [Coccomyxa sp. Obi]